MDARLGHWHTKVQINLGHLEIMALKGHLAQGRLGMATTERRRLHAFYSVPDIVELVWAGRVYICFQYTCRKP